MRRLATILLATMLLSVPASVRAFDDPRSAGDFIRDVGREMAAVIGEAGTFEARRSRLTPFVARVVDVPAIARFCLGRYWNRATPEQRQDYQTVFQNVLVNTIASWSGHYANSGHQTVFEMARPIVEPDGTRVPTTVQTGGGPPAQVTWLVDMDAHPPRLLDVVAGGLSLRVTLRSDYTAYLGHHDGDVQTFIETLRRHAGDASGNPFTGASPNHP